MARTAAIGLRRDPQPPIPMVIPLRNSPIRSSSDSRLSAMSRRPVWDVHSRSAPLVLLPRVRSASGPDRQPGLPGGVRVPLLDEGGPLLVGHAGHVQLVGEPLLEPI